MDQVGLRGGRVQRQTKDAPTLPHPVAGFDVIGALGSGVADGVGLLGREEAALRDGETDQGALIFHRFLGLHNGSTILNDGVKRGGGGATARDGGSGLRI
jgi:hypothetical protein